MEKGIFFLIILAVLALLLTGLFYMYPESWKNISEYFATKPNTQEEVKTPVAEENTPKFPEPSGNIDDTTNKIMSSFSQEDSLLLQDDTLNQINSDLQAAGELGQSYNGNEF